MRIINALTAFACALALGSCTGKSNDKPAPTGTPLTPIVIACARFEQTADKITAAQTKLFTGTATEAHDAVTTLTAELTSLRVGAPADVQKALDDMIASFRRTEDLLRNPTAANKAKAAGAAPTLAADGQKITKYIVSKCGTK